MGSEGSEVEHDADAPANRRAYRRRQEDIELWANFSAFVRHSYTRRMVAILLSLMVTGLTYAYTKWKAIPSPAWQAHIVSNQDEAMKQFNEINTRVALLEQRVQTNADLGRADREEIKQDIRDLRTDLQRWFREASRPVNR